MDGRRLRASRATDDQERSVPLHNLVNRLIRGVACSLLPIVNRRAGRLAEVNR
jgi:hypothetical protein